MQNASRWSGGGGRSQRRPGCGSGGWGHSGPALGGAGAGGSSGRSGRRTCCRAVPEAKQRWRRVQLRRRRRRRRAPGRRAPGRAASPVLLALAAAGSGRLSCRMCGRRRRQRAGPGGRGAAWLRCPGSRPRPLPTGPRCLATGTPHSAPTGTANEPRRSVYFGSSGELGFFLPQPRAAGLDLPRPPFPITPPPARCFRASLAAAQLQGPRLASPKRRDPSPLSPRPPAAPHASNPSSRAQVRPRPSATSLEPSVSVPDTLPHTSRPKPDPFALQQHPSRLPRRLSPPFPTPALLDAARRPHPFPPPRRLLPSPVCNTHTACFPWHQSRGQAFFLFPISSDPLRKSRSLPSHTRNLPLNHFSRTLKLSTLTPVPGMQAFSPQSHSGLYYPTRDFLVFFPLSHLVYFSEADIPN